MEEKVKIFGYGSLLNKESFKRTCPSADNFIPVVVKGYKRVFDLKSIRTFDKEKNIPIAVLNIRKTDDDFSLNGICAEISIEEFDALKEREKQYKLVRVKVYHYKSFKVDFAYLFILEEYEEYDFLFDSYEQERYMNVCIDGAREYGPEFLKDFLETTYVSDRKTLNNFNF